jgi:hypothetical protein
MEEGALGLGTAPRSNPVTPRSQTSSHATSAGLAAGAGASSSRPASPIAFESSSNPSSPIGSARTAPLPYVSPPEMPVEAAAASPRTPLAAPLASRRNPAFVQQQVQQHSSRMQEHIAAEVRRQLQDATQALGTIAQLPPEQEIRPTGGPTPQALPSLSRGRSGPSS